MVAQLGRSPELDFKSASIMLTIDNSLFLFDMAVRYLWSLVKCNLQTTIGRPIFPDN